VPSTPYFRLKFRCLNNPELYAQVIGLPTHLKDLDYLTFIINLSCHAPTRIRAGDQQRLIVVYVEQGQGVICSKSIRRTTSTSNS
jgi:hypothetical protein